MQCKQYALNIVREEKSTESVLSGMGATITIALTSRAYGDSSLCYIHNGIIYDAHSKEEAEAEGTKIIDNLTYTAWQNLVPSSASVQEEN